MVCKKPLLGGSLFSSSSGSIPPELQPLAPLQVALSKATMSSGTSVTAANTEYDKMHDPNTPLPTPPVHAARLSQLLKSLANAESSVSEIIKSRQSLIDGLEKLLDTNRSALAKEQSLMTQLSERKAETEAKKREVEDGIMRGLSADSSPVAHNGDASAGESEPPRPEVEALTPPVEALTPVGSPKPEAQDQTGNNPFMSLENEPQESDSGTLPPGLSLPGAGLPGLVPSNTQSGSPSNGVSSKKRKVVHGEDDYAAFAGGDLDADVAELLRQESNP
ncbi:hypothetical protein Plec18170_003509 [Paecilomyces lecythidis]